MIEVNPAFTSMLGLLKYSARKGIGTHMGAAVVIGRRGMGFSEHLPKNTVLPYSNRMVSFVLPVRNRTELDMKFWACVNKNLKKVRKEQWRLVKSSPQSHSAKQKPIPCASTIPD